MGEHDVDFQDFRRLGHRCGVTLEHRLEEDDLRHREIESRHPLVRMAVGGGQRDDISRLGIHNNVERTVVEHLPVGAEARCGVGHGQVERPLLVLDPSGSRRQVEGALLVDRPFEQVFADRRRPGVFGELVDVGRRIGRLGMFVHRVDHELVVRVPLTSTGSNDPSSPRVSSQLSRLSSLTNLGSLDPGRIFNGSSQAVDQVFPFEDFENHGVGPRYRRPTLVDRSELGTGMDGDLTKIVEIVKAQLGPAGDRHRIEPVHSLPGVAVGEDRPGLECQLVAVHRLDPPRTPWLPVAVQHLHPVADEETVNVVRLIAHQPHNTIDLFSRPVPSVGRIVQRPSIQSLSTSRSPNVESGPLR